jgi:hypothetical protein
MKVVVTNKTGDKAAFPFFMYRGLAFFEDCDAEALDAFVNGKSCSTAEIILCWMNEDADMRGFDEIDEEFSYVVMLDDKPCSSEEFRALPYNAMSDDFSL